MFNAVYNQGNMISLASGLPIAAAAAAPVASAATDVKPRKKRSGGGNKKGTSAERRATHNAVERARRESLNTRFLQLAAHLPSTAAVRRPSKSLIVNKSIAFVTDALAREPMYRSKIDALAVESEMLRQELNELRRQSGLEPRFNAPTVDLNLPKPMADPAFDRVHAECMANLAAEGHDLTLNGEYDDDLGSGASDTDPGPYQSNYDANSATLSHASSPYNMPAPEPQQQQAYFVPGTTAASFRRNSYVSNSAYSQSNSSHGTPPDSTTYALLPAGMENQSQLLQSDYPAHQPTLAFVQQQQQHQQHAQQHCNSAADFTCATLDELLNSMNGGSMGYTPSDQDHMPYQQQLMMGHL